MLQRRRVKHDVRLPLLEEGVNIAEAVLPRTAPANAEQLALFAE